MDASKDEQSTNNLQTYTNSAIRAVNHNTSTLIVHSPQMVYMIRVMTNLVLAINRVRNMATSPNWHSINYSVTNK